MPEHQTSITPCQEHERCFQYRPDLFIFFWLHLRVRCENAAGFHIERFLMALAESRAGRFFKVSLKPTRWIWLHCMHWIDYSGMNVEVCFNLKGWVVVQPCLDIHLPQPHLSIPKGLRTYVVSWWAPTSRGGRVHVVSRYFPPPPPESRGGAWPPPLCRIWVGQTQEHKQSQRCRLMISHWEH